LSGGTALEACQAASKLPTATAPEPRERGGASIRLEEREGVNRSDAIPEIESIQFFDSIIAIRKKRQLPRAHVRVPEGIL
jgi:hypothetical protein